MKSPIPIPPTGGFVLPGILLLSAIAAHGAPQKAPTPQQRAAFQAARTVSLQFEVHLPQQWATSHYGDELYRRITGYAGLQRAPQFPAPADLSIDIIVNGKAICAQYTKIGRSCSGASVSGTITMTARGAPPYAFTYAGQAPPTEVTNHVADERDAPYGAAFLAEGSSIASLLEALAHVHGERVLDAVWVVPRADRPAQAWLDDWIRRGGKAYRDFLLAHLRDNPVRAARLLEEMGEGGAAIPVLRELLSDPDRNLRDNVVRALSALESPDKSADLIRVLRDPDPLIVSRGIHLVTQEKIAEAAPELVRILSDPALQKLEPDERRQIQRGAISGLGILDHRSAADMIAGLVEADERLSSAAGFALARFGDRRAIPLLIEELRTTAGSVAKRTCIERLAEMPSRAGFRALMAPLRDARDPDLQKLTARILEQNTGQRFGLNAAKWEAWMAANPERFPD